MSEINTYYVTKPLVHNHKHYSIGKKIDLTQREAQFLLLAGKVSSEKSKQRGNKHVADNNTTVSD